jgi:hypothetical protein
MLLILEPSSRSAHVTVDGSVFDFKESKKKRPSSAKEIHVDTKDLRCRSKEGDKSEVLDYPRDVTRFNEVAYLGSRQTSSTPPLKSRQCILVDQANLKTPYMKSRRPSLKRDSVCPRVCPVPGELAMMQQNSESPESGIKHQVDKLMEKLHMATVPFALIRESMRLLKTIDHEGIGQSGAAYEV